jgi:hypothetical protein
MTNAEIGVGSPTTIEAPVTPSPRKLSWLLILGIVFMPYIFAWFTLRAGYSRLTRITSFCWAVVALGIGIFHPPEPGALATSPTASPPASESKVASPAAQQPAPPPGHAWVYREGSSYGYLASLSANDRAQGQAAQEIRMFQYLGEKDGRYVVSTREGSTTIQASCDTPCSVVKVTAVTRFGTETKHLVYNPDSVAGAALTDAINGQMEIAK